MRILQHIHVTQIYAVPSNCHAAHALYFQDAGGLIEISHSSVSTEDSSRSDIYIYIYMYMMRIIPVCCGQTNHIGLLLIKPASTI